MATRVSRARATRKKGKRRVLRKGCKFVKGDGAICGVSRKGRRKGKGCKKGRRKDGKCRKRWKK